MASSVILKQWSNQRMNKKANRQSGNSTCNKQNAAKLAGLYDVNEIVLDWEDSAHFLKYYDELRKEYQPEGMPQEVAVAEISRLQWQKKRLNNGCRNSYYRKLNPHLLAEARKNGPEAVRTFIDGLSSASQTRAVANAHLETHLKLTRHVAELTDAAMAETPDRQPIAFEEVDQVCQLGQSLCELTERSILPMLKEFEKEETEVEWSSRPELILSNAKAHAELDRQIQKHLQQLVQLKEYRRLYHGNKSHSCIDVTPSRIVSENHQGTTGVQGS
jgi:hypothetical protein